MDKHKGSNVYGIRNFVFIRISKENMWKKFKKYNIYIKPFTIKEIIIC